MTSRLDSAIGAQAAGDLRRLRTARWGDANVKRRGSWRSCTKAIGLGATAVYIVLLYSQPIIRCFLSREVAEMSGTAVLLIGAFAAVTGVNLASESHPIAIAWPGAIFVALVFLSGLSAEVSGYALALSLYRILTACLAFMLFSATAGTNAGLQTIVSSLAVCAFINAAVGVWGAATHQTLFGVSVFDVGPAAFGYDPTSGRSGGFWGSNYSGIYNLPGIVAAIALIYHRRYRLLAILMIPIGITGTMVSFSRGSTLTLAVGICAFVVLVVRKWSPGALLAMVTLLVVIILTGAEASDFFLARLPRDVRSYVLYRYSEKGVANEPRLQLYRHYLEEVRQRPLLGGGPGHIIDEVGWDTNRNNANVHYAFPHNSLLDVIVEFGIPALVLFAFAILSPLVRIKTARKDPRVAFLYVCYVGTLISSMTLSMAFAPMLWGLGGAVVGAARRPPE